MQAEPSFRGTVAKAVPGESRSSVRRVRAAYLVRQAPLVAIPVALIVLLAWPMLFTDDPLSGDWLHHLALIWSQSEELAENHHPSLFYNYSHAILYPQFAFYGATIYAIAGTLSLLLGGAPTAAYVATYLIGFAVAYGGWYWLARMAGLGRWRAHVPGVLFITSGYYITLIYARGDWPEFLAVSTIPLLVASILSVLRAERLQFRSAVALAGSTVVFFGSHDLTIIWGSTALALVAMAAIASVSTTRRWLTARAIRRLAVLMVPALLVNAWFLLPTVAYEAHTEISHNYPAWRLTLKTFMVVVSASNLFGVERVTALPGNEAFVVTLPVLAIAWALTAMALFARRGLRDPWTRVVLIFAGFTTAMAIVMTHAGLILALPRPFAILQFSYRLESFVLLGISATVLAVLVVVQRGSGRPRGARAEVILGWALVPILIWGIVGAAVQAGSSPGYNASRQEAVRYSSRPTPREKGWIDYVDAALPPLARSSTAAELEFPVAALRDDRITRVVHLQPGEIVYTNIGGGPELVHVSGAEIVGVGPEGNDVLQIGRAEPARHAGDPPSEVLTVEPANELPVALGRAISLAAIAFLGVVLTLVAIRSARSRGDRHAG